MFLNIFAATWIVNNGLTQKFTIPLVLPTSNRKQCIVILTLCGCRQRLMIKAKQFCFPNQIFVCHKAYISCG